ncbi:YhdP family protein [Roseicella aquatilis]|uniref:YhdP central domain-containing protein n=1 Tax=Roseicella aquatilis TaxID=2527868 RepID=A0A4R4D2B0_9PROT|nr:AsmA-like C-terminal region-containing protein [Roseicella aquatilis]TCZ52736.1 hypothetical protein EXY23_26025 [Roseicella aquatilis]
MSAAEGQAPPARRRGPAWRWGQRLATAVVFLLVAALLGTGVLAWRLAQRPLDLPQLARRIEAAVNARPDGPRLSIGEAAIAWEGFHGGTAAPLAIRLRDVTLRTGDATAELPEASVTLSVLALLRGGVAPATIELRRPRLHATLTEGGIALGLDRAAPVEGTAAAEADLATVLAGLMRPASEADALAALRRIRVNGGEAVLADPSAGLTWTLLEPQIDLRRADDGGLAGSGTAVLRAGAVSVPVRLSGQASGTPMRLSASLLLPALRPAELAAFWPPLAPLAVLDAPVTLAAQAEFDAAVRPDRMQARLEAGAGVLALAPGQRLPLAGLAATVEGNSRALTVRQAELRLPGQGAQPGPVLTAQGEVQRGDGGWQARLDLAAGPVQAATLPGLWPEGLAPPARAAVLRALPAGLLRTARARLEVTLPPELDGLRLDAATLDLAVAQAVFAVNGSRVPTEALALSASYRPEALHLDRLSLRLPAAQPGTGPLLQAEGSAALRDGAWQVSGSAKLDAVSAADLPGYWPAGIGGNARSWITQNLTAGRIRNGQWTAAAELPATLDAIRLTALSGSLEASDVSVHWLRPVPPVQGTGGTVEFGLTEVVLRGGGGRQMLPDGKPSGLEVKEATVRFSGLDTEPGTADIAVQLAGPLADAFVILKHPRLKLFEKRPLEVQATAGQAEARLAIGFPLWADLPIELLKIRGTAKVTDARLVGAVLDRDLDRAAVDVAVDTDGLKLSGGGQWLGAAVRLGLDMDFRTGRESQVIERGTLTGRLQAARLPEIGFDPGRTVEGPVALDAKYERRRNGQGSVGLRADLRDAWMGVEALHWNKAPGAPGLVEASLRLQGDSLAAAEGLRLDAADLSLRGRAAFGPGSRLERVEVAEGSLGASRFVGDVRRPEREGGPWRAALRGPLLDLKPLLGPPAQPARPAAAAESGPPLQLDLRFDRVTMGEGRNLLAVQGSARTDARGVVREARASGRTGLAPGQGEFEGSLLPQGQARHLRLSAADGGALLHALDVADAIQGGRLTVNASYAEPVPGAALSGTAELDQFVLRDAPAMAKLLQGMTLYGLVDALRGGSGLVFTRLVAPFSLSPGTVMLSDARAFSSSLGLTAKGQIHRDRRVAAVEGTIVPAYMFNTLLGHLPIIGRLFSPETGGGVFAATYRVQGPLDDPQVTVNPLAALTPGFLRGLFGLGSGGEAPGR